MESSTTKPHAVLLSSPGIGHLIPVLELGKRLVTLLNFDVTIFVIASKTSAVEFEIIQSAMNPKLCHVIELPPPDISSVVGPKAKLFTILRVMMHEIRPTLRSAISSLKSPPTVMIVDLFGTESLMIGEELEIPKYVYIASHAWFVALTLYLPTLDKIVQGEYVDQNEALNIPGCMPVRPGDVPDPMLDRNDQQYFEYVRLAEEMPSSDGVLVNTWEDFQQKTLAALRDDKLLGRVVKAPIYTVGPIVRQLAPVDSNNELFNWLDKQPSESVVFVSFGSGGTLSCDQLMELAWGLELSQQRFIWVVRPPTVESGDGSFFTVGNDGDDLSTTTSYLPEGFLARTHNRGIVVPKWGPQLEILSHPSVGGFFSHCGWNSTLESLTSGVPIIVWPLYAEQKMNATLLVEELEVAVRPERMPTEGVVGREEIQRMVRRVMVEEEGSVIRRKVHEIKRSAERANREGGSSYNAFSLFEKQCQSRLSSSNGKN